MVYITVIKTRWALRLKTKYKTLLHIKNNYYVLVMISLHNSSNFTYKKAKNIIVWTKNAPPLVFD